MALAAVLVVAGGVAALSAYEAHVINVTAHIENALSVPTTPLVFGTVFPQEDLNQTFEMGLSTSFLAQNRICEVNYDIVQKPKCKAIEPNNPVQYVPVDRTTHECPALYRMMADLCQFLSKEADLTPSNDISHPSYYTAAAGSAGAHCLQPVHVTSGGLKYGPTGWGGWSCPANTTVIDGSLVVSGGDLAATYAWKPGATTGTVNYPNTPFGYTYTPPEEGFIGQNDNDSGETIYLDFDCMPIVPDASGKLVLVGDTTDLWTIDLKVPPFAGYVAQDWPAGCPVLQGNPDGTDLGCDLWIEVTGFVPCRPT